MKKVTALLIALILIGSYAPSVYAEDSEPADEGKQTEMQDTTAPAQNEEEKKGDSAKDNDKSESDDKDKKDDSDKFSEDDKNKKTEEDSSDTSIAIGRKFAGATATKGGGTKAACEHDLKSVDEVPATCEEDGKKAHYHCEKCGLNFLNEGDENAVSDDDLLIWRLYHDYDYENPVIEKPATATEDGLQYFICQREGCGHKLYERIYATDENENLTKYTIVEGNGQKWAENSTEGARFVVKSNVNDNNTYGRFSGVYIDGFEDGELDEKNFKTSIGSLILELDPAYLNTLAKGNHTIDIFFYPENAASGTFEVTDPVVEHNVIFDANGHGVAPDAQKVKHEEKAEKPEDPKEDGWIFKGWVEKDKTEFYDFDIPVVEDITLYAVWEEEQTEPIDPVDPVVEHNVIFDANGHGVAPDAQKVKHEEKAEKPEDPKEDGWIFKGWVEKDKTEFYDFDTPVVEDITLYAVWEEEQTEPIDPVDPDNPDNPSDPTDTVNPSDPTDPSNPDSPGKNKTGKSTNTGGVKTGDASNTVLWSLMLIASFIALAIKRIRKGRIED